jgi:glycogen(starch) synthase
MTAPGRLPARVLMSTDAVGGVWEYSLELAAGLVGAGVEVVLGVLGPGPDPEQRTAASALGGLQLETLGGRLEWMDDPWTDVDRTGQDLLALAARHRVDLVHLGSMAHGALPFGVPRVVVAHSCVCSWWPAVKGEPAPPGWDSYRRRVAAGIQAAEVVVAPSAAMLASVAELYGQRPGLRVIPNGRRPADWAAAGPKQPLVLAAGRLWDEAKNVARLAAIARRLPWPVQLAGEGPATALDNVDCPGRLGRAALRAAYGRAAIYALPARYEPFGLSVLEAALAGCALVLGDIPSLRELWGDAALFVPPDDEAALLQALRALIADEPLRRSLAAAAGRRAEGYGSDRMIAAYLDLYRRLLQPAEELACAS